MSIIGRELAGVRFSELISQMGIAIAESQFNLDKRSIDILKIMGNKELAPVYIPNINLDSNGNLVTVSKDDKTPSLTEIKTSMIGAGFQPTFYQFAETIIEVKIAVSMTQESSHENTQKGDIVTSTRNFRWRGLSSQTVVTTTPVDAKYSSKYNYSIEGSSLLRTRLVPLPPNPFMQRLLDMKADAMQMAFELEIKKAELAIEVEKAKIMGELKKIEDDAAQKIANATNTSNSDDTD
jgi:hypothetical protein